MPRFPKPDIGLAHTNTVAAQERMIGSRKETKVCSHMLKTLGKLAMKPSPSPKKDKVNESARSNTDMK